MEQERGGIDFLNLPHSFRQAVISKCSLVTWSRLLRTSKYLDEKHGKTNVSLQLHDHRILWFVNDKYFLRNSFTPEKPTLTEIAEARTFTKNRQFVSLTIRVPRICIMVKTKEYCSLIYGKLLTLQLRSSILHIVEFPKSELINFPRLVHVAQASSIWTDPGFTSQKTLLSMTIVSQINRLYLPNKRIDGKIFLSLRTLLIEVDSTNISHIAIVQWLKELKSSDRIIQYVKLTELTTNKRSAIFKKIEHFIRKMWRTPTTHMHTSEHITLNNLHTTSQCYEFQSDARLSYVIMEDDRLNELHIGLASGFLLNQSYFPCSCMRCVGILPVF